MSLFDYESVRLLADFGIHPSFKTDSSHSSLYFYKTKDVANPDTELFGSRWLKIDSFEVYAVEIV